MNSLDFRECYTVFQLAAVSWSTFHFNCGKLFLCFTNILLEFTYWTEKVLLTFISHALSFKLFSPQKSGQQPHSVEVQSPFPLQWRLKFVELCCTLFTLTFLHLTVKRQNKSAKNASHILDVGHPILLNNCFACYNGTYLDCFLYHRVCIWQNSAHWHVLFGPLLSPISLHHATYLLPPHMLYISSVWRNNTILGKEFYWFKTYI